MLQDNMLQAPSARKIQHPGPVSPVRIQYLQARKGRHIRLTLRPGNSLYDALVKPLAQLGIESASTTILSCQFRSLKYCVAPPDPSKEVVAAYGPPIDAGESMMIFGNATIGKNTTGRPIVHCHAAVRTEAGHIKGGHILADQCIVGALGGTVLVTSLDDFELRVAFDPETNIQLLQPLLESGYE